MNILVFSISSPPEKTGIGKYNSEMIEYLSNKGHKVQLLTTLPYYPEWKLPHGYKSTFVTKEDYKGADIVRIWSYLPKKVTSIGRIFKEITFYLLSIGYLLIQRIKGYNPDVVIYVAPPFFLPVCVQTLFFSSKHVYHIQDFEVDAAIELKMLPRFLEGFLKWLEKRLLARMDLVSTISDGMMNKLKAKGAFSSTILFPNWSDTKQIYPAPSTWLHQNLNISENKKLVIYSGNIGEKQGLDKLPQIIKAFEDNHDLHFVIIGEGAYKETLVNYLRSTGLKNYTVRGLVEKHELNKMLNSSFLQLVLQKSEGADAFLPSKLTNILAAGIPSIITALPDTSLYNLVKKYNCGIVVEDNITSIVEGIKWAYNNQEKLLVISDNAVNYSKKMLDKELILSKFEGELLKLLLKSNDG